MSRRASNGFPWPTLVLGSGALELRESVQGKRVDDLPESIAESLSSGPSGHLKWPGSDDISLPLAAREFTRSLILDRLGPNSAPAPGAIRSVPPWKSQLVGTATVLTYCFHVFKAQHLQAIGFHDNDVVDLNPSAHQQSDELRTLVEFVQGQLKELVRELDAAAISERTRDWESVDERLRGLLGQISANISLNSRLSGADVGALTDIVWMFLIEELSVYPGWADLMTRLSLEPDPHTRRGIVEGHPRPPFREIGSAAPAIERLLLGPTRSSVRASLEEGAPSERDQFYTSAARLLCAQAAFRSSWVKDNPTTAPPPASAFVTSFDLELEFALVRQGHPFVVALPVMLKDLQVDDKHVSTAWVGRIVTPDEQQDPLSTIRESTPEDWFVLSRSNTPANSLDEQRIPSSSGSEHTLGELPFVVRISGAPLIRLPSLYIDGELSDLGEQLALTVGFKIRRRNATDEPEPPQFEIQHSTLIEEYHSLQQSLAEFEQGFAPDNNPRAARRRGLDPTLSSPGSGKWSRFWLLCGVPVADPVVRYRLVSHLAGTPRSQNSPLSERRIPLRQGLVIQREALPHVASDVLRWSGFDIVADRCERLIEHLDHLSHHLTHEPGEARLAREGTECPFAKSY